MISRVYSAGVLARLAKSVPLHHTFNIVYTWRATEIHPPGLVNSELLVKHSGDELNCLHQLLVACTVTEVLIWAETPVLKA